MQKETVSMGDLARLSEVVEVVPQKSLVDAHAAWLTSLNEDERAFWTELAPFVASPEFPQILNEDPRQGGGGGWGGT